MEFSFAPRLGVEVCQSIADPFMNTDAQNLLPRDFLSEKAHGDICCI